VVKEVKGLLYDSRGLDLLRLALGLILKALGNIRSGGAFQLCVVLWNVLGRPLG
jgi:hypothetical protein